MKRLVLSMVLGLLMALIGLVPAEASIDPSSGGWASSKEHTEVRYTDFGQRSLTPDEKRSLVAKEVFTTKLTLDDSGWDMVALAKRCGTSTAAYKAYNASGHKLYEYRINQWYCRDGNNVSGATTPQARVTVTDLGSLVGWSFEKHITAPYVDKQTSFYYRTYGQGHFRLSPIRVGSIQNTYPWVQIDSKGDGTYWAAWGKGA